MPRLPSVGTGAGNAFLVWCLLSITASVFIALKPLKFFRMISWGRPLPRLIENRWVLIFYRVTAVVIFIWVFQLLFQFFTA
jgi:hypothetical protein